MLTPTISVLLMVSEQPQAHAGTDQYREAKQGSDFNLSLWGYKIYYYSFISSSPGLRRIPPDPTLISSLCPLIYHLVVDDPGWRCK